MAQLDCSNVDTNLAESSYTQGLLDYIFDRSDEREWPVGRQISMRRFWYQRGQKFAKQLDCMLLQDYEFPYSKGKTPLRYLFTRNYVNDATEKFKQMIVDIATPYQEKILSFMDKYATKIVDQNSEIQKLREIVEQQQQVMKAVGSAWNTREITTGRTTSSTALQQLLLKF